MEKTEKSFTASLVNLAFVPVYFLIVLLYEAWALLYTYTHLVAGKVPYFPEITFAGALGITVLIAWLGIVTSSVTKSKVLSDQSELSNHVVFATKIMAISLYLLSVWILA